MSLLFPLCLLQALLSTPLSLSLTTVFSLFHTNPPAPGTLRPRWYLIQVDLPQSLLERTTLDPTSASCAIHGRYYCHFVSKHPDDASLPDPNSRCGGFYGTASPVPPTASSILATVSYSTLLRPLTLLLTSLGPTRCRFSILPSASLGRYPSLPRHLTLLAVLLPSTNCYHTLSGPLSLPSAFPEASFRLSLRRLPRVALAGLVPLHAVLLSPSFNCSISYSSTAALLSVCCCCRLLLLFCVSDGTSRASYTYETHSPIHGPGQGSRGGPSSCSTMTALLIEGMDQLFHGLTFCNPSQHHQYSTTVKMFIDDASNCTNDFLSWLHAPPAAATVTEMLQHDAQTWERLLWTSGGLLNFKNRLYYVIYWKFDLEGKATMTAKTDLPTSLCLTSGPNATSKPVQQHNFDESHTYLGDTLASDLQMQSADIVLMNKGLTFSRRLIASPLSKRDVWIAYFAIFVPAMTYTFPVTHHSTKSLTKIQSGPTRSTLMKLDFNRNTAKAVAFGPTRYLGLGLRDLAVEQGIAGITLLIRHLQAATSQGILMMIIVSWWQLLLGTSFALLEEPSVPISCDIPHWLSSLRNFLAKLDGSLHIADLQKYLPQPLRNNDVALMDAINALPDLKKSQKAAFNQCRVYLGVTFLSEISTADGTSLARDAWDGTRPRLTPFLWPHQPHVGPKTMQTW
jgi:hypothetical protein